MEQSESKYSAADIWFSQAERERRADQLQDIFRTIVPESMKRVDFAGRFYSEVLLTTRKLLVGGNVAFVTPPIPDINIPHPDYAPGITFDLGAIALDEPKPSLDSVWGYVKNASTRPSQTQVEQLWENSQCGVEYASMVYIPPNEHEEKIAYERIPQELAKLFRYHKAQPIGNITGKYLPPESYLNEMAANQLLIVRREAYREIAENIEDPFIGQYPRKY